VGGGGWGWMYSFEVACSVCDGRGGGDWERTERKEGSKAEKNRFIHIIELFSSPLLSSYPLLMHKPQLLHRPDRPPPLPFFHKRLLNRRKPAPRPPLLLAPLWRQLPLLRPLRFHRPIA